MRQRFMDDEETIRKWGYVFGFVATCVLWAVVITVASGILA